MGDLNAMIGLGNTGYEEILGKHDLEVMHDFKMEKVSTIVVCEVVEDYDELDNNKCHVDNDDKQIDGEKHDDDVDRKHHDDNNENNKHIYVDEQHL